MTKSARFSGFPAEALDFLEDLEANNTRAWFQDHRDVYERACRAPMQALLAELEPEFGTGRIFRINRDIRFSADKSLYKTHVSATVPSGYISLSPQSGLYVGFGGYMLDGDALTRFREAVAADASGTELDRIASSLERSGYELGSHGSLKSAPKGYPKDHPRVRFLRMKGLHAGKSLEPGPWLSTRKALERVRKVLADAKPLNTWLDRYVGGS